VPRKIQIQPIIWGQHATTTLPACGAHSVDPNLSMLWVWCAPRTALPPWRSRRRLFPTVNLRRPPTPLTATHPTTRSASPTRRQPTQAHLPDRTTSTTILASESGPEAPLDKAPSALITLRLRNSPAPSPTQVPSPHRSQASSTFASSQNTGHGRAHRVATSDATSLHIGSSLFPR